MPAPDNLHPESLRRFYGNNSCILSEGDGVRDPALTLVGSDGHPHSIKPLNTGLNPTKARSEEFS